MRPSWTPTGLRPTMLAIAAAMALVVAAPGLRAEDAPAPGAGEFVGWNQESLEQKAELEKLVSSRDMDLYELGFEPLELDEVILKDRIGREHVFNYLTFRLRNQIADATVAKGAKPTRYAEVLDAITKQYESAKTSPEGGGKLTVETTGDPKDGVILERGDLKPRTRKVSIKVQVTDEHGTRLRLLDDPIGSGTQETYNFPDLGEPNRDTVLKRVREAVEEKEDRRLHTVDEIRALDLPPYDAQTKDEEGVAAGEVYGVVLFNRLSLYGNQFTVEVRGLSNKFRLRMPPTEKGKPDNYLATHVLRRNYVLHYTRPGDEYFRNLDRFTLVKSGWEWVDSFQRIKERANVAYAKYYLDNIVDDMNARQKDVETDLWKYYGDVRTGYPDKADKLPDLEKSVQGK